LGGFWFGGVGGGDDFTGKKGECEPAIVIPNLILRGKGGGEGLLGKKWGRAQGGPSTEAWQKKACFTPSKKVGGEKKQESKGGSNVGGGERGSIGEKGNTRRDEKELGEVLGEEEERKTDRASTGRRDSRREKRGLARMPREGPAVR